jgi:site-specific recombinase XerD
VRLPDAFTEFEYSKDHSPTSRRWYASRLGAFIVWAEGQGTTDIEAVTAPLVRRYLDYRRNAISATGKPIDSHTLHGHARAIKALLHWAVREDLLDEKVPRRIEMPRKEVKVLTIFTERQLDLLFAAAEQGDSPAHVARDKALLALLIDTGARASELCSLRMEDVHFTPDEAWILVHGKGRKQRELGLGKRARQLLYRYVHRYRRAAKDMPYLFVAKGGVYLHPAGLDRVLYRLRDRAGAEHFKGVSVACHRFRHHYAVTYLEQGGDIYKLSRLLGHSSVQTTEGYLKAYKAREARKGASILDRMTR